MPGAMYKNTVYVSILHAQVRNVPTQTKHTSAFILSPGTAAERSNGSRDRRSYRGSGPRPPAAAAEQGFAATPDPARAAAERAGGPRPESNTPRAAATGAAS